MKTPKKIFAVAAFLSGLLIASGMIAYPHRTAVQQKQPQLTEQNYLHYACDKCRIRRY